MIGVIEEIDELLEILSEIEEIYKGDNRWGMLSPTFTINAYKAFMKNSKNTLYFIVNKHEEKIESYLPLYIDARGTLRFILDDHTDYCGTIGKKLDGNFLRDLAKTILSDIRIKRFDFDNLLFDDQILNGLKYHIKYGLSITAYNSHSYVFSDIVKGYYGMLKGKNRSELKRVAKKNSDATFSTISYPDPFPTNQILSLRNKMVLNGWREESFLDDDFLQFIISLYEAKELVIIANYNGDDMVSVVFTLQNKTQNSFIFWITLYDQDVQYINLTSYLNFITANEFKDNYYYSFARGDYAFKATFAPVVENLYNVRYSKSKWDFYFTNYYSIREFVKRIVKGKK